MGGIMGFTTGDIIAFIKTQKDELVSHCQL
jgi:hypothetical protein